MQRLAAVVAPVHALAGAADVESGATARLERERGDRQAGSARAPARAAVFGAKQARVGPGEDRVRPVGLDGQASDGSARQPGRRDFPPRASVARAEHSGVGARVHDGPVGGGGHRVNGAAVGSGRAEGPARARRCRRRARPRRRRGAASCESDARREVARRPPRVARSLDPRDALPAEVGVEALQRGLGGLRPS